MLCLMTLSFCFIFTFSREYKAFKERNTWQSADSRCNLLYGTSLATITSEEENAKVLKAMTDAGISQTEGVWIGYNDKSVENNFVWSDQTQSSYTNWNGGQPNNAGSDDCVRIDGWTRKWRVDSCGTLLSSFVCNHREYAFDPACSLYSLYVRANNNYYYMGFEVGVSEPYLRLFDNHLEGDPMTIRYHECDNIHDWQGYFIGVGAEGTNTYRYKNEVRHVPAHSTYYLSDYHGYFYAEASFTDFPCETDEPVFQVYAGDVNNFWNWDEDQKEYMTAYKYGDVYYVASDGSGVDIELISIISECPYIERDD